MHTSGRVENEHDGVKSRTVEAPRVASSDIENRGRAQSPNYNGEYCRGPFE
jgi:hypothetical protein